MNRNASAELRTIVETATPSLERTSAPGLTDRPAPGKWSKTEILGHLTDSAANSACGAPTTCISPG